MAKFVFIVPPLSGHVNPTLSLGNELLERKHEVAWISFDPNLEKQLPKGGKQFLIPVDLTESEKKTLEKYIEDLKKKSVYGLDSLKFLYEEVLIPMNTYIYEGISQLLEEFSPHVVITDHQVFAGSAICFKKNIPYVTSVTAPASIKISDSLPMVHTWESEQVISYQQKHGIEGNKRLDCSDLLTLVYTSELFFGEANFPDNYKFIGPVLSSRFQPVNFDWDRFKSMGDQPKILISIGTTFDHTQKQQFFKKVTEAFKNEKLTVTIVSNPELFDDIPENFIIQEQVPQVELLPYMQAVICHGGHNTVCEALFNGIPLIVLPIAYDQSYVASCVTESQAGIRLNFNRFKPEQLKESTYKILKEAKYREGAEKIQQSFKESGGVKKGADYLENLLN